MTSRYKKKKPIVSTQQWQDLALNEPLALTFSRLSQELSKANAEAMQKSVRMGGHPDEYLDLKAASILLQNNPQLLPFVRTIAQQSDNISFLEKKIPTESSSQGQAAAGTWSTNKHVTDGVVNARILRDWADSNEWVRAAINIRRQQIGRANIAVVPFNERRTYNKTIAKRLQLLLDQPNEMRQNYYDLMASMIDDVLVIDRGVILKDMSVDRKPVHLYNEDGACIKIYPEWNGNPNEPRYLYESASGNRKVPLRNDEAIVLMANPATYRYGLAPVQVLRNTIQADLAATRSATQMVDFKPPPHMIQLPGATQAQLEQVRARYETDIAGRKEIFWLGGQTPAQVTPLIFSAKDNQWLEWQIYLARKIAVVFQISPQQLGITYDINKATASSQQEIFEDTGLIPLLLLVEEYFNREVLSDFAPILPDGRANFEALNLRIIYPEVTEADRQMHAERAIEMAKTGLAGLPSMTLNQVLALFGEEGVDGGNTFYAETRYGPVAWLSYDGKIGDFGTSSTSGMQGAQDAAGGPDEDEDEEAPANGKGDYPGPTNPASTPASGSQPSLNSGDSAKNIQDVKIKRQINRNYRLPGKHWVSNHPAKG